MAEIKTQKTFTDHGFGFPVKLLNVPMIKVRGKWTPNIDYNELTEVVLVMIANKPVKLAGNEVKFIRQHFEMTLQQFAKRFGVSHPAVVKWEKSDDEPTNMSWSTEKDLRLFILSQLESKPTELAALYNELEQLKPAQKRLIKVDLEAA
jgi:DNA-binding transcriptional regulator YiaG